MHIILQECAKKHKLYFRPKRRMHISNDWNIWRKITKPFIPSTSKCWQAKRRLPFVLLRRIQPYLSPPLELFWVYPRYKLISLGSTLLLDGKIYSYHSWPLGKPSPAVLSLAGSILASQRLTEKNFKVSSFALAYPSTH